jgi:hypothetical protein
VKWKRIGKWWHGPTGERIRGIYGSGGGSQPSVKGPTVTENVQQGDPELRKVNKYVTGELLNVAPQYGGLAGLLKPQDYMFTDYGREGGPESAALGGIRSFYGGPTTNPYELAGLSTMQGAADPERQLAAGRDYLERIASPELKNYFTSIGQGRSGAIGEGIADASAKMALPILQQSTANQMQYGGTQMNYGQMQRGRELESLSALYNMAAMPRMEQASAEQSARDTLLSTLLRFPVSSGAGSSVQKQFLPDVRGGEPPVWQQVMGGLNSVLGIASMVAMCWVASQLYGWTDPRKFVACFYQVNFGKPSRLGRIGRSLYRRYGRSWARSRLALCVLRPIFNRVAEAGARNLGVVI